MSGEQIARAIGLYQAGAARWHGTCPCCGYRTGFTVAERRSGLPLVYCNAGGCGQAELIAALRRRCLWPDHDHKEAHSGDDPDELARRREAKTRERSRKIELAADMWQEAYCASGLIETYFRLRDILLPVPPVIRMLGMHGAYGRHPTGARRPQMIARVEHAEHGPVAVHRTFLAIDGSGKASLDPVRMSHGPVGGAAVRLAPAGSVLAIAAGIETALSYMQATIMPFPTPKPMTLDDLSPEFSDDALALEFTARHARELRYVAKWGTWLHWDGTRWKFEDTLKAFDLARAVAREFANACADAKAKPKIASASKVAAIENLARADRRHAATIDQWDADPWLLNTPGGIVDLHTGNLLPHNPAK